MPLLHCDSASACAGQGLDGRRYFEVKLLARLIDAQTPGWAGHLPDVGIEARTPRF